MVLSFGGEWGGLLIEADRVPVSRKKVLCAGAMSLGKAFQIYDNNSDASPHLPWAYFFLFCSRVSLR